MPISKEELLRMQTEAAEAGAKRALAALGLDDNMAHSEIKELRDLLKAWKTTKTMIWQTIVRYVTTFFLGVMSLGIYMKIKGEL